MKPHKAVININFSVFPVEVTGEASGQLLPTRELREAGVRPFTLEVKGTTKEECLAALKTKLESFK